MAAVHELAGIVSFDTDNPTGRNWGSRALCANGADVIHQIIDVREIDRGLSGSR
ncbi:MULTISPECIES: hypothetical protein [Mesorhizobium]|uniref:hypothetical protein n=1 Tax=Mesorhizobium TaxID=68287 RepID=UPI0012E9CBB8|nr:MULTISPECIES: hypothetical protein [Mesorhizobium]QIA25331.1 hypothetical protein A9K68_028935 [Mesorhizobium sp. AA22]